MSYALDGRVKNNLKAALISSRKIEPFNNNWLLFVSMIEAALIFMGEPPVKERLDRGLEAFRDKWYVGDGLYGDGKFFHFDYYNSFVIQPMLLDILRVVSPLDEGYAAQYEISYARAVLRRVLESGNCFDDGGWLVSGVVGYQPQLGERYISTGSLYLCCAVFLPLGLAPSAPFWVDADELWTGAKAWRGECISIDHALADKTLF